MTSKVDVRQVVLDHFRTLRRHGKKRAAIGDVTVFYVLPLVIMLAAVLGLGLRVNEGLANALFTGFQSLLAYFLTFNCSFMTTLGISGSMRMNFLRSQTAGANALKSCTQTFLTRS